MAPHVGDQTHGDLGILRRTPHVGMITPQWLRTPNSPLSAQQYPRSPSGQPQKPNMAPVTGSMV